MRTPAIESSCYYCGESLEAGYSEISDSDAAVGYNSSEYSCSLCTPLLSLEIPYER